MTMTKEDVAVAVRAWCTAWHTRDMQTIMAMEARAVGFGLRPFAWRNHLGNTYTEGRDRSLEQFFGQKHSPGKFAGYHVAIIQAFEMVVDLDFTHRRAWRWHQPLICTVSTWGYRLPAIIPV